MTICRAPKPGFPRTAAETAAETAGETRGAGGNAGGTAVETAGSTTPPSTPSFPGSFRSSLSRSPGESGLGGPVDSQWNRNFRVILTSEGYRLEKGFKDSWGRRSGFSQFWGGGVWSVS